ncbi:MAG: pimeloyl-ACP methyl ester carboxylesterase [Bacillariaceae sp.]|jgi:pimeloyl-ACP methyl ester carboxylesterase
MLESVEHSLQLKDGRILAYHTFPKAEDDSDADNNGTDNNNDNNNNDNNTITKEDERHPVLYFHGYPGCGLEGGLVSAHYVARAGGRLYAIDRAGMGKTSSPYKYVQHGDNENGNETNADGKAKENVSDNNNLDTFVENIWELVEDRGWEEFSVIGVSGGGPHTLALLASYLERRQLQRERQSDIDRIVPSCTARLRNVCMVGAVCMSAGSNGMKNELVHLASLVETASTTKSRWSRFKLGAVAASTGAMFNYLVPALPFSLMMALNNNANKDLPAADREWLSDENNIRLFLSSMGSLAAQGGNPGVYDDAMIALRAGYFHEKVLRKHYGHRQNDNDSNSNDNVNDNDDLPTVGIFQGGLDMNVPPSHARFLHEYVFQKRSEFFGYDDLGHISTIAGKSEDYAVFATARKK